MGDKTSIEWTDATWNPIVGCSIVSPGCTNCYAMKWAAARLDQPHNPFPHYRGTTKKVNGNSVWTGKIAEAPEHILTAPLRWKKPRHIFVNSMGDLFHESVPNKWIDKVFAVMALCPQHTFQVLTKRSKRMREYIHTFRCGDGHRLYATKMLPRGAEWPLQNVWLGVSCEDQERADERIPDLLSTPAAVRFVSAEPLLGPIDFFHIGGDDYLNSIGSSVGPNLDWVIVGGESGPGSRPMRMMWAEEIRDQCRWAGKAFHFKQWGEWRGGYLSTSRHTLVYKGGGITLGPPPHDPKMLHVWDANIGEASYRVGKKKAGRLLDGAEHNGFPVRQP